jgi:hypothetical protein
MVSRCTSKGHHAYPNYGGRGIIVCARWLKSFERFWEDVGNRPSPKHSLDRFPDNNGDYEPGNVRWATVKEQRNNSRQNRVLEYGGVQLTLSQWSERTGIESSTVSARIRAGWTVEEAMTTSVDTRFRRKP